MMKFLFAFALVALAGANTFLKPSQPTQEMLEIQEIIAAIQSPSTHPVTAAALEAHLMDLLGIAHPNPEPISIGPALVDFDHVEPVDASPAVIPPVAAESSTSPLVQIILNIKQASSAVASPVEASPVIPTPVFPDVVQVVDHAPADPVQVVESAPEPVQIVDIMPVVPVVMPEILN